MSNNGHAIRNRDFIVVGCDLGDLTTQISYCTLGGEEPQTLSSIYGGEQYNIPTMLCKRNEISQWFHGREAEQVSSQGDGIRVDRLVSKARNAEEITMEDSIYDSLDLLTLFVKRAYSSLFKILNPKNEILSVVFTVDTLDNKMIEILNHVVDALELDSDVYISYQPREESFFSYMIHQNAELWQDQVLVLDSSEGYVKVFRLEMNKKTEPIVAFVDKHEFDRIDLEAAPTGEKAASVYLARMDTALLEVARGVCETRKLSACYLIGDFFADKWCNETLRYLCSKCRVFQGNNMFSKGACYSGRTHIDEIDKPRTHVFLGNDKLKANIGMKVLRDGVDVYYAIMNAGQSWFETKKEFSLLLDDERAITLIIVPVNGKNTKEAKITFANLPKREKLASRILVTAEMTSETTLRVHIKDLGFGDIFPSTGLEWEENIPLEEEGFGE